MIRLNDAQDLTNRSIRRVYIKNGRRKMMTDSGVMLSPASLNRRTFGRMKGGKYSDTQK